MLTASKVAKMFGLKINPLYYDEIRFLPAIFTFAKLTMQISSLQKPAGWK